MQKTFKKSNFFHSIPIQFAFQRYSTVKQSPSIIEKKKNSWKTIQLKTEFTRIFHAINPVRHCCQILVPRILQPNENARTSDRLDASPRKKNTSKVNQLTRKYKHALRQLLPRASSKSILTPLPSHSRFTDTTKPRTIWESSIFSLERVWKKKSKIYSLLSCAPLLPRASTTSSYLSKPILYPTIQVSTILYIATLSANNNMSEHKGTKHTNPRGHPPRSPPAPPSSRIRLRCCCCCHRRSHSNHRSPLLNQMSTHSGQGSFRCHPIHNLAPVPFTPLTSRFHPLTIAFLASASAT